MNKTIMITGATAGFGQATAMRFAKNGYNIIITGRRKERLDELEKELLSYGK
ncbi:MAG: SDR family NAD(P)-dependent oxidoreductase, partial [Bacteroidia bacterium]|nr:SDR family NAD(P)-dependent oxidoreductase [Bacteroidia bacterium]